MKSGDRIRIQMYMGRHPTHQRDYTVEEFRNCLGIFLTANDRKAGNFTPLCELYGPGPESELKHIANYGEYYTNQIPIWTDIPVDAPSPTGKVNTDD